jgi:hypothetical protein
MKSKLNSDPAMRHSTVSKPVAKATPGQPAPASSGYAPSVPISVYRELAAELQATKTLLDSLNAQNQQLTHQNQQLRYEIERVVQSALYLRQVADSFHPETPLHPEMVADPRASQTAPRRARSGNPPRTTADDQPLAADPILLSEALFTEQADTRSRTPSRLKTNPPKEVGGLWLILIILAIVITAFGAGFLVVRPLLPSSR